MVWPLSFIPWWEEIFLSINGSLRMTGFHFPCLCESRLTPRLWREAEPWKEPQCKTPHPLFYYLSLGGTYGNLSFACLSCRLKVCILVETNGPVAALFPQLIFLLSFSRPLILFGGL